MIFTFNKHHRWANLVLLNLLLSGCLAGQYCLGSENKDDVVSGKLSEFEKRLADLERRVQGETGESELTVEIEELKRQLAILAEEFERLRSGEQSAPLDQHEAQALGLSPSATRIYEKKQGVSLAGYGEMVYENFDNTDEAGQIVDKTSQVDFLRAILYAGYRFNDRFLFNSEIEIEHASTDKSGSVSLEFGYVDFLVNEQLSLRGGMLLVPMGLINEFHEPNVFLGTLRPQAERVIIPSTWREAGFGAVGNSGRLSYRGYLVNGLNAGGFTAAGLRGGRQKGSKAKAESFAFIGRIDFSPTPGSFFGASLYRGGSGQGQFELHGQNLNIATTIWEIHAQSQFRGWDLRGLFVEAHVADAGQLNLARGLTSTDAIAERMRGGYLQGGFNLLVGTSESMALTPFYRFESVNTQSRMPAGFLSDPATHSRFHTLGLEFKPIYNIVIKGDYRWARNEARVGLNQFNLGLGYSF